MTQSAEKDAPHNHVTRDIKPRGQCPGCDRYHDRHSAEKDAPCEHAWEYSNTPGVNTCTTCGDLRDWPKGAD